MDQTPLSSTQTIHPNNDLKNTEPVEYSEAEKNYALFKRRRLISARDQRDAPRDEYDGMTFLRYMDVLKKHDDQYIAPRLNKVDTAINTGTIRDKDTTLVEYATKYDFEPVAQCYDLDDEMLNDMAETAEDMVRKSLMLEEAKTKFKLVYRSMVAFGTAVVEDQWVERWTIEKKIGQGFKMGSLDATWTDEKVKTYDGCQFKLWDIRKCYWGDISKFFMNGPQGQPFFFTAEYETYDKTAQMFGDFDRWKDVPKTVVMNSEISAAAQWSETWCLRPITTNTCEIIRYYDPIANEYGLSINGIEMLPIMHKKVKVNGMEKDWVSGFPLTVISLSGAIPMAKYDLEPMHDFAISKSQPGKMRVYGDIENMVTKLILGMFKQKAKPTMGNKSGRTFGEEVTDPATVINDIREGDLFPVLPNFTGPSASDFSFYKMIQDGLSRNSIEDSFQGIDNQPGEETATQDMNDRKAQSLKIAALFDGIIFGNGQLYWLRTYNIAKNWTKPIDYHIDTFNKTLENKYRTISVPSEIDGGEKATKKIVFTTKTPKRPKGKPTLEDSQEIHQEEVDGKKNGKGEMRVAYIHPEVFAQMKLSWFYTSIPVPNDSDPLSYVLFAKQVTDAINLFGRESINVKKLKHRFASITGNDFDTWFISQQELDQVQQKMQQDAMAQAGGQTGNIPGKPVGGQPTIANASGGQNLSKPIGALLK